MHLNGNLSKVQTSSSCYPEQSIICTLRAKHYSQRILQYPDDSLRDTLRITHMRNSRSIFFENVRKFTRLCEKVQLARSILSRGKVLSQLTSFIRKISFCGINLLSRSTTPDRQFATRKKFLRTLPWKRHNTRAISSFAIGTIKQIERAECCNEDFAKSGRNVKKSLPSRIWKIVGSVFFKLSVFRINLWTWFHADDSKKKKGEI